MKKITLISLIIFAASVGYIYFFDLISFSSSNQNNVTIFNQPIINTNITTPLANNGGAPILNQNEIAKHSTPNDCYLFINDNVYDVSSYIGLHPGGDRQITSRCGREVTGIFAQIHSNRAWDLLAKYKIGTLVTTKTTNSVNVTLNAVETGFKNVNPKAEIVNVKLKKDFYIAKVIYNSKLYEVHIDSKGTIIKEEVESDEFDWSLWDMDSDDK